MSEDFDYEAHERLRGRVANEADSVLWTFKAYYEGADWYAKWDRRLDWLVFGVAALLTIAIIWDITPKIILASLAIITAVVSGYRRMADPGDQAENFYRAAHAYHRLFDDFRDFIQLDLAKKETGLDAMRDRYNELAKQRRNLNEDMPEITSKWYDRLDSESVYEEVETTEEARQRLAGEANLIDSQDVHDLSEGEVKDQLSGNVEFDAQSGEQES